MHFRHQDQDTKRKNISKLENRILEKGSLLHECCVKASTKIPPSPKCQYLGLKFLQVQKIGIEDFPTWILTLRFLKMITVKPKSHQNAFTTTTCKIKIIPERFRYYKL